MEYYSDGYSYVLHVRIEIPDKQRDKKINQLHQNKFIICKEASFFILNTKEY